MKNIKNVSNSQTVEIRTFESGKEFMAFLAKFPNAQEKALEATLSHFRYHITNSKISTNVEKIKAVRLQRWNDVKERLGKGASDEEILAAYKAQQNDLIKKFPDPKLVEIPVELDTWLLTETSSKGDPTEGDKKRAAELWTGIQIRLEQIENDDTLSETEQHEAKHALLNKAAEMLNTAFHASAQLPTLSEAFDDEGVENEHPFDLRRLESCCRVDRIAADEARKKAEEAKKALLAGL